MNIKYKILQDKFITAAVVAFSLLSIVPLFLILFDVFRNGWKVISWEFLTTLPSPPGESGGGVLNSLVGTVMLIVIAVILSVPIGVFTGIFIHESNTRFSNFLRTLVDVLQGLPSIVIGIVAYLWLVKPFRGFSAFAGGFALALIMLPVVVKNTEETLKLIPYTLREASYALGVGYTRTILKVVLPAAYGGIASGVLVAVARIAGETAPLIFTAFGNPFLNLDPTKPVDALPLLIFNYATSPYENWHQIAWGASVVLIVMILVINIIVRRVVEIKWKTRF